MYIQLKDFNSYMSPQNKDWLYIFVQSLICILLQTWCNILRDGSTAWAQNWLGSESMWCLSASLWHELQIWSDRDKLSERVTRCLTSRRAFVFTRSEKKKKNLLWTKKKKKRKEKTFLATSMGKWIIALFAWHAATQTQTSNVPGSQMFTIPFFYVLRVTTTRASNHKRSWTNFRAFEATQKPPQTVTLKPEILWALSLQLQ